MSPSVFPAPPPTRNNLDATDRAHLVRSTRKVGAMLGVPAFVFETSPAAVGPSAISLKVLPHPLTRSATIRDHGGAKAAEKHSRRQGSVFELPKWDEGRREWVDEGSPRSSMDSSASSEAGYSGSASASLVHLPHLGNSSSCTSSDDSDAPRRPRGLAALRKRSNTLRSRIPPPLRLAVLAPYPLPSPDDDELLSYPRAPLSPLLTLTPASPRTPTVERAIDARVRKLEKLTRTLGERVPPELAFHAAPPHPAVGACPNPSIARDAQRQDRRESDVALVEVAVERVADPCVSATSSRRTKRRSMSLSAFTAPVPAPQVGRRSPKDAAAAAERYGLIRTVERAYPAVVHAPTAPSPYKGECGMHGWVGEWNREDMREVRSGLRALRVR